MEMVKKNFLTNACDLSVMPILGRYGINGVKGVYVKEELIDPNREIATAVTLNNDSQMTSVLEHNQLFSNCDVTSVPCGCPSKVTDSEGR